MEYAIVQIAGKQYAVREGEELLVDRVTSATEMYDVPQVLLVRKNGTVHVGNPFVTDAVIRARYLGEIKGKKIRVSKFKAKVRYDKTIGFRPIYSKLKIETVRMGNEPEKTVAEPASSDTPVKKAAPKKKVVVKKTEKK